MRRVLTQGRAVVAVDDDGADDWRHRLQRAHHCRRPFDDAGLAAAVEVDRPGLR